MHLCRLIFLLLPLRAFALYNGNPSLPAMPEEGAFIASEDWLGIKLGYLLDDVYNRKLHMEGQDLKHCRKTGQYDSLRNLGVLTFNFMDRVEVFGTLGSLSMKISHRPFAGKTVSYHSNAHFAWGVGGRAILAWWGDLQLALNASWQDSSPGLSSFKVNQRSQSVRYATASYREWQVGMGTSYCLEWFIPYVGIDYSDFRTRINHLGSISSLIPSKHVTFKSFYPFGLYFGFGLSPYRAFNVNVEARCINENAISLSADFRF